MSHPPAGPREVLGPGIARIALPSPTLPPATTTNVWLLGEQEVLVVDPGSPWPTPLAGLIDQLAALPVRAVFLTHHHTDHASGARAVCDALGVPLWSHATTGERTGLALDRTLADGETLVLGSDRWQAILTEGHADGHLCLARDDGEVVAGDMVAGEGTILLAPPDADLAAYLASLARLRDRRPTRLLPAHGPALAPAVPVLDHYIAHRHARTDQARAALGPSPRSATALAPVVYPELPPTFLPIAALQLTAHLDWLVDQGAALRHPAAGGGPARYSLPRG